MTHGQERKGVRERGCFVLFCFFFFFFLEGGFVCLFFCSSYWESTVQQESGRLPFLRDRKKPLILVGEPCNRESNPPAFSSENRSTRGEKGKKKNNSAHNTQRICVVQKGMGEIFFWGGLLCIWTRPETPLVRFILLGIFGFF